MKMHKPTVLMHQPAKVKTITPKVNTAAKSDSKQSWRRGVESSTKRGYGYKWQQRRKQFLQRPENVCCVYCARLGLTVVATVVDHIKPHRGDQELFWDENNWQSLCSSCHSGIKQREESRHR